MNTIITFTIIGLTLLLYAALITALFRMKRGSGNKSKKESARHGPFPRRITWRHS